MLKIINFSHDIFMQIVAVSSVIYINRHLFAVQSFHSNNHMQLDNVEILTLALLFVFKDNVPKIWKLL